MFTVNKTVDDDINGDVLRLLLSTLQGLQGPRGPAGPPGTPVSIPYCLIYRFSIKNFTLFT